MAKVLWVDVETGGLNPTKHALLKVAFMYEEDGDVIDTLVLKCNGGGKIIEDQALDVNRLTRAEVASFPSPEEAHRELIAWLTPKIDKYDKTDKAMLAGYRVSFDILFLRALFEQVGDTYYGSWFSPASLDVMTLVAVAEKEFLIGDTKFMNRKLLTVCKHFKIPLNNPHDPLDDITATAMLYNKIIARLKDSRR